MSFIVVFFYCCLFLLCFDLLLAFAAIGKNLELLEGEVCCRGGLDEIDTKES